MKGKPRTSALMEKYPWIVKWGKHMGSFDYYVEAQLVRAEQTNAPTNATFENTKPGGGGTGQWSTVDDITNEAIRYQLGLGPKKGNE